MKILYFHGQYKENSFGINEISYNISDLPHMSKVAAHFQKKNKMFIYKESGKVLKKRGCEAVFRTLSNIYDVAFSAKIERLKASS